MLTVVTWKWGNKYTCAHVTNLRRGLETHLHLPFRLVVISDDEGLPDRLPMPDRPRGAARESIRLWLFSREAETIGDRILNLDLDVVPVSDITPLVDRDEPFVIFKSESRGRLGYALNPSVMLFTPGHLTGLWGAFERDAAGVLRDAARAGFTGSEQAVIGNWFKGDAPATWTERDGIVSFRGLGDKRRLPPGTRLVSFHGPHDPARIAVPWLDWRQ